MNVTVAAFRFALAALAAQFSDAIDAPEAKTRSFDARAERCGTASGSCIKRMNSQHTVSLSLTGAVNRAALTVIVLNTSVIASIVIGCHIYSGVCMLCIKEQCRHQGVIGTVTLRRTTVKRRFEHI